MKRNQLQYHASRMSAITELGAPPAFVVGALERINLRGLVWLCRLIVLAEHLAAQINKHFINIG
jgi:hypothetical protein